jgi:AraC family transcriptional regulator of adaptative response / DNA-3-methyladenine glycosylase II
VLAEADPADFAMPVSRKKAIKALATALADDSIILSPGSDWEAVERDLLALHGIGPWTVAAVRMRGLGDPDVFLPTDLGIQKAMVKLGLPGDPRSL